LYCIVLYCIVLNCIVLYCIVLFLVTTVDSRFQASTAMSFISSLFWDVTQHMLAVGYPPFGTTYRPIIKVWSSPRPPTETLAAWRTCTAETSMLPIATIVKWVVLERMHVEHWWYDTNRWQYKYSRDTRSSANLSTISPIRTRLERPRPSAQWHLPWYVRHGSYRKMFMKLPAC